MSRILLTGMSGVGKSSLLAELAARGFMTIDTDYDGWTGPDGLWDEARVDNLLASHANVVLSGTTENQGQFYDRFEHIVLLTAPVAVLIERVSTRTTNPYGHTIEQQNEIRRYVAEVEPLLRRGTTVKLDARRPLTELADAVEKLM